MLKEVDNGIELQFERYQIVNQVMSYKLVLFKFILKAFKNKQDLQ